MQPHPVLAVCARALAEDRPEVAGVLRGAAYAAFARKRLDSIQGSDDGSRQSHVNFFSQALRETGDIVTAVLGDDAASASCVPKAQR